MKKYFFVLVTAIIIFTTGCSKKDSSTPNPETNKPKTVTISSGTITSQYSDSPAGNDVGMLMDNNANTFFVTQHNVTWIIYKLDKPLLIDKYAIVASAGPGENNPKSFTLSGSNDGYNWTDIQSQSNQSFSSLERKEYSLTISENNKSYNHYKLAISSNNGGSKIQLAEWQLHEAVLTMDDLMQYASGSTKSNFTPMGNHYEQAAKSHTTTDADRAWLSNPLNEPSIPSDLNTLKLAGFNVVLYPNGNPVPADVNQHDVGDCGAVAAIASMAYLNPGFIKSIIKDNGDRTFTVSMFDPQGKPVSVTVSSFFLANSSNKISAVSGKNSVATWASVLEKAIMKYNMIYKVNPNIGGIGSEHVIPLFTGNGNSFAFSPGTLNGEQLARAIKVSLSKGKFIIGGFNSVFNIGNLKTVTLHAYTLMLPNAANALFAMRNAWGFNPPSSQDDGVLQISNLASVTSTIDLRIVDGIPGTSVTTPYNPPASALKANEMRVSERLLNNSK